MDRLVTMSWNAVETWLDSLGLHGYWQAFIDNGYDELDVCRQIGSPDLDAIGVTLPADRARLLSAVDQLQTAVLTTSSTSCVSGSATAPVYFTLENPDTTTSNLTTVVSERLSDDGIALSAEPYTSHLSAEPYTTQVNSHDCGHGPQCPRSTSRKQVHARRGG